MGITLPAFTPLEDSLWLTLCCRALDNRAASHPRRCHSRRDRP